MGIKATVVYDIPRHATIVLRTRSVSISERYEVIDTIASFANHCESLRGVAHSVTEVSAHWGGPPYLTYEIAHDRFRVIVIWDEEPGEFDLSHDVEDCLLHLKNAVMSVQDALAQSASKAVAKVYDEAGYALRGDTPIVLPNPGETTKKVSTRSKLLPSKPPSGLRRLSSADPKRKRSSAGGSRLLGKLGNAFKNVTGGGPSEPTVGITHSRRPKSPLQNVSPSPGGVSSGKPLAVYGSENGFDDELGGLELPHDVFAWASFGKDLPDREADLTWFEGLMKGETNANIVSQKPALRKNSVSSTPLTLPSSASPLSKGTRSVASSVLDERQATQSRPTSNVPPSSTTATTSPIHPNTIQTVTQIPSVLESPIKPSTIMEGPLASKHDGPPVISTIPATNNETLNKRNISVSDRHPSSEVASKQDHPLPPASGSFSANTSRGAESMDGLVMPLQNPPAFTLPLATGQLSPVPPSAPRSDISRTSASSASRAQIGIKSISPAIPPALAAQMQETREFDVSRFGEKKANPSGRNSDQNIGASSALNTTNRHIDPSTDETLRNRMNEFAMTMQAGNFTLALQQVIATLKMLRGMQPRRERETITCSNYVIAQKILIRNAVLESELVRFVSGTPEFIRRQIEMALLMMFLAELKHLLPRHRVAAMKVAIEKNIVVGNFGMCARWLRHLVEKAPPAQKEELYRRLEVCEKRGETNAQMPPTNRLCYITLQVLTSPHGACSVCSAVYHPQMAGVVAGQICPTCFVGAVVERM